MTIREAKEEFLTYLMTEKGDSGKTLESYKVDLEQFIHFVEKKDVKELNGNDLGDFLSYLSNKGYKNSSLIRKSMAVKGFYKFLKNEGEISLVLSDLLTPKKEQRLPDVLNEKEISRLFASIDQTTYKGRLDFTLCLLCFSCGLRVSELVSLRKDKINPESGQIRLLGKRSKERIVPVSSEALEGLFCYLKERNKIKSKSNNLFVHLDGSEVSRQYFYLEIKKYAKDAKIEKHVSPHTLRHSYATLLLENGAQLKEIKELLGHEDISTTQIYTHISKKKEEEEYHKAMRRQ